MRRQPGAAVVLRETWRGRIWTARPAIVVRDAEDAQMFFVSAGMRWMCPHAPDGTQLRLPRNGWTLAERQWDTNALSFAWPGVAHAILAFWEPDWVFRGWYVNLQEPLRRTAVGFDYMDHALDIVIAPDLSTWSWKDEDELEEAVARGVFSREQASAFRGEGERALARILNREPPFDGNWTAWRPDASWPVPVLPPGWDQL